MSREDDGKLWTRLSESGLVQGPLPLPSKTDSPWYVRAMMGVAGWIGAIFLLLFLAVGFKFIMDSEMARMVVGILLCGAAAWLFKIGEGKRLFVPVRLRDQPDRSGPDRVELRGNIRLAGRTSLMADCGTGNRAFLPDSQFPPSRMVRFRRRDGHRRGLQQLGDASRLASRTGQLWQPRFSWAFLQEFDTAGKGIDKKALGYGLAIALLFSMFTKRGRSFFDIFEGRHSGDLFIVPWIGGVLAAIALVATVYVLLKDGRNAPMEGRTVEPSSPRLRDTARPGVAESARNLHRHTDPGRGVRPRKPPARGDGNRRPDRILVLFLLQSGKHAPGKVHPHGGLGDRPAGRSFHFPPTQDDAGKRRWPPCVA